MRTPHEDRPDLSDHDDTTMATLPVTTARVLLESMSSSADSDDESLPELVEPVAAFGGVGGSAATLGAQWIDRKSVV